jgi:hypothetical protein
MDAMAAAPGNPPVDRPTTDQRSMSVNHAARCPLEASLGLRPLSGTAVRDRYRAGRIVHGALRRRPPTASPRTPWDPLARMHQMRAGAAQR